MRFNPALQGLEAYHSGPPLATVMDRYGLSTVALLNANECPEGPFPEVVEAIARMLPSLNRYPSIGADDLRGELAVRCGVPETHFVFGNGSCEILSLLAEAVVAPGDTVVYASPSFVMYEAIATVRGAHRAAIPLRAHTHDLQAMLAAIGPQTAMAIVCNPNNPTGTLVEPGPLRDFLSAVPRQTLVVLDEAYVEYVTSPAHTDSLPLLQEFENLVVLRTFSKIYGLAGLRIGYGIASPVIVEALDKVRQPFNVTSVAQAAAAEAVRHPDRVRARREHAAGERDRLYAGLGRLGIPYIESEANFVMADLGAVGASSSDVAQTLLRRGVIVRTGEGVGCPGWIRATVGAVDENDRLLEGLSEVVERVAGDGGDQHKET